MGISSIFYNSGYGYLATQTDFYERSVKLSLFSDNIIFETNMAELLMFIPTIIFTVIIIKFLIKATKKFINMIFGVFRV